MARKSGRQTTERTGGRRWLIAGGVIAILLGIAGLWGYRIVQVAGHLSSARRALLAAEAHVKQGNLPAAGDDLSQARAQLVPATNVLHGVDLTAADMVPVLHQNLRALKRTVAIVLQLTEGGRQLLDAARPLQSPSGKLELPIRAGVVPLTTASAVQQQLRQLAFALPGARELPRDRLVVGRVATLQKDVYREAARRRREFSTLDGAIDILTDMAGANGPRRYLIAVANAAEMRGTGGMILSYGVLSSAGGKFSLDRFGAIDEIKLSAPVKVDTPADYLSRFAPYGPTLLWRNATITADYSVAAPIMEKMFTQATGLPVDGVIQVDSAGLGAILRGIGPVDVEGLGQVTADNVVPLTINEAYTKFPNRPVRQEFLGTAAEVIFRRLVSGDFGTLRPLAEALVTAAAERHVIFHTMHPEVLRTVSLFGAAGGLPPEGTDFAALAVENFSANKLDYYLATGLNITGSRPAGRLGHIKVVVDVANTAPPNGAPPYVFGPNAPGFAAGEYRGLAQLYLPTGAYLNGHGGDATSLTPFVTTDAGRTVISFDVVLNAGQRKSVTLDIVIPPRPPGLEAWQLIPVPRVRPTVVVMDIEAAGRRLRYSGSLSRPVELTGS
jgi:hypothetical protein